MPNSFFDPLTPSINELSTSDTLRISRRSFAQHAAIAAALSLSPAHLLAGSHDLHGRPRDAVDLTTEQTQDVEAKLANIVRKFGDRLSDQQRQHLRRILGYNEKMLASVRAFSLQNGDPPASVLRISFASGTLQPGTKGKS